MAYFNFETKALKSYADSYVNKVKLAAKDIAPTPFPMEYEFTKKDVYQQLEELDLEVHAKKNIIKKKFSIVTDLYATLLPTWNWPAAIIAGYIIQNLEYNSNIIKITEEDFKTYSGMSVRSFYEGLSAIVRNESPYICAGDSLKLIARTTRKSIYIVNHNIIFKGKLEKFIEIYKEKFPNPCELDSRGKVVIRN